MVRGADRIVVPVLSAPGALAEAFEVLRELAAGVEAAAGGRVHRAGQLTGQLDALAAHMKKKELYTAQTILPVTKIGLFLILLPKEKRKTAQSSLRSKPMLSLKRILL